MSLASEIQSAKTQTILVEAGLGREFTSETATVTGITLHYVRGGKGPPVILIHGFPRNWFEYHAIMPRLEKQFTVIAVDLRGVGGSTATPEGYDAANMKEDVHQLGKIEQRGGKISVPKMAIQGIVWMAFAQDPEGNMFGILEPDEDAK